MVRRNTPSENRTEFQDKPELGTTWIDDLKKGCYWAAILILAALIGPPIRYYISGKDPLEWYRYLGQLFSAVVGS